MWWPQVKANRGAGTETPRTSNAPSKVTGRPEHLSIDTVQYKQMVWQNIKKLNKGTSEKNILEFALDSTEKHLSLKLNEQSDSTAAQRHQAILFLKPQT